RGALLPDDRGDRRPAGAPRVRHPRGARAPRRRGALAARGDHRPVSARESERNELIQVLVTIGIAVATLAIAAVGFLHARANSHATEAGQASDRYAVLTMSSLLQSQEDAKVSYEEYLRAQDQRGQAGNALQQSVFSSPSDRALLALVQERWQQLAARTQ